MEYLKFFDTWGANLNFQINRKTTVTSWQAGLCSLLYIVIALTYLIIQSYFYFNYSYTKKYSQTNYQPNPNIEIQYLENFMLAFCHGTASNSTQRDPIAHAAVSSSFEWHYFIRNPWLFEDKVMIPLHECTKDDFPQFVSETYTMRLFQQCQCISYDDLKPYNFSFYYTGSYASYFVYKLYFKDSVVADQNQYQYYSDYYRNNSQRVFAYFVDSQGDVDNYNNPFNSYINYNYAYLSPDIAYSSDLLFSQIDVNLDDNLFVKSKIKSKL
jgi:hypothetical protein